MVTFNLFAKISYPLASGLFLEYLISQKGSP
jgi:hypothetical protein